MQDIKLEIGQLKFNKSLCKKGLVLCVGVAIGIYIVTEQPTTCTILESVPLVSAGYFIKQISDANKELKKLK